MDKYDLIFIIAIVAGFLIFFGGVVFTINHLSFPGEIAQIESLRSQVQNRYINEKDHVFSEIVENNMQIESNKKYRTLWWSKLFLPSGWDDVEPIEIYKEDRP